MIVFSNKITSNSSNNSTRVLSRCVFFWTMSRRFTFLRFSEFLSREELDFFYESVARDARSLSTLVDTVDIFKYGKRI